MRYMCVVKTYQWNRLLHEGDIITLPVGTRLPFGERKDKKTGKVTKVPYFKALVAKKGVAPVKAHLTAREIKYLKNRLTALYARTNLTEGEEAEKVRIQDRIASIDRDTSLGTPISKEETLKRKEKEVEAVSGTRPMSMAETQAIKHKKFEDAKKKE